MKNLSLLFVLCFSTSLFATPIKPETISKLQELRASIRTWAPTCNGGGISTNRDCNQFDSMEFTGLRCITGDLEMCDHIRRAQGPDGRWFRAEAMVNNSPHDSFSRDMLGGLMFYWTVTKDVDSLNRWMDYLKGHNNMMCDDASDNRCQVRPGNWILLGYLQEYLGLKVTSKMKWYRKLYPQEMMISAKTAHGGYPLMLISNDLFFLKAVGINEDYMTKTAEILLKREPENPVFQYHVRGKSEEWAKVIMEACPMEASEKMDDFFIQRELARNDKGQLIILRDDWGADNHKIPVSRMANGHDCLILLNLALN